MKITIKKGAPKWAMAPFENFGKEIDRISHVVYLTERGIRLILETKEIRRAIVNAKYLKEPNKKRSQYKLIKKEVLFANREVKTGFPIIHAWAVVGLWALLESLIRNFVAMWLKHKKSAWKVEVIDKLRIRLGEYESIPKDQKHFYIVELLEHELSSGSKPGISRFETLLTPFKLSGSLPKQIADQIYELSKVRNLIAHNSSKIDRQFKEACPWIFAKIGTHLHISDDMLKKYLEASLSYVGIIICRIGELYGVDMNKTKNEIENKSKPSIIQQKRSAMNSF